MISDQYPPIVGGYERQAQRLSRALTARGHSVTVVTGRWPHTGPADELDSGVRVHRLPTFSWLLAIRGMRRYRNDIYERQVERWLQAHADGFDVIHAHSIRRGAAAAIKVAGPKSIPVLVKEPNSGAKNTFLELDHEYRGSKLRSFFLSELRHVAVLNDLAERQYAQLPFRQLCVHRIFNGIELDGLPTHQPVDPPRILALSRLRPEKNTDLLLDAFAEICSRHPRWTLRICGDGPESSRLEARVRDLGLGGRVELAGSSAQPLAELAAASLMVVSSLAEGMSNSLLEALAVGTPAIATRVGSNEELLADETGWLVPPSDVPALAATLDQAMLDPAERARRSLRARQRAQAYSIDAAAQRMEEVYAGMGVRA